MKHSILANGVQRAKVQQLCSHSRVSQQWSMVIFVDLKYQSVVKVCPRA